MEIKVANKEDFKRLEPILLEVEHHHVDLEPEVFQWIDAYDFDHFCTLIDHPNEIVFYAEVEGEVAGVLIAIEKEYPLIPMYVGGVFAEVEELSVTKRFRRKGVAKALMTHVEKWARSRGRTKIQLSVWARNTGAIELYEKLGYERKVIRFNKPLE